MKRLALSMFFALSACSPSRITPTHDEPSRPRLEEAKLLARSSSAGSVSASVSLVGFTCDQGVRPQALRFQAALGWFELECAGTLERRYLDAGGNIREEGPFRPDACGGARPWPIGGQIADAKTWLAMAAAPGDGAADPTPRIAFCGSDAGAKIIASEYRVGAWRLAGLGPWLGGATVAFLVETKARGRVVAQALDGLAAAPLPAFTEAVGSHFNVVTTGSGSILAAWNIDSLEGGVETRWRSKGAAVWQDEVLEGVALSHLGVEQSILADRSSSAFYLAADDTFDERQAASVRVMRRDEKAWSVSLSIQGARGPRSMVQTADGAVWVLVEADGQDRVGMGSEVWRRRPGVVDVWDQMAGDVVGRHTDLSAIALMPAGPRDVLLAGRLARKGIGLYRVHLVDEPG